MTERERPGIVPRIGPGIERSRSIEDLHHLRLMALLDEQVRDKGVRQAAADLDVDHRTLAASLESGRLTRRMRVALDRALLAGGGSPAREQQARNDELAGRLESVEAQVKAVGEDAGQGLADVRGEVSALRSEHGQALERVESRLAQVEAGGVREGESAGKPGSAGLPAQRPRPRREFPELATLEPADDDREVFGGAWPLVLEWRNIKENHPGRGQGLEWLRVQERLLTVELALLEEHGLTLPPETYPLKGLDRGAQVNWRLKALGDTGRARRRRELLVWLPRALTARLWRR